MVKSELADETRERIDTLHHGIVVELHRRLCETSKARDAPFRFHEARGADAPARDSGSLSRSIEQALIKVSSMQNFIRSHEETIYVLRQATAEHERQLEEARRLQVKIGRKCREEAERASRSERLTELLEQRNKQLELDYAKLTRKVDGLLRAIHPV